ncbi:MAG TPA: hypothetical protein VFS97_03945 [Nitrososphaeraceae archaeon]|nr:hypothetical protein [Nitrososphaeraceae archaeon]
MGQQVFLPGCRATDGDCLHIHWRWGDMTPTIDPLVDPITDSPVPDSLEGDPYLVPGQTIDVAIVKYHSQEAYPTDPTTLVNGETIGSTKTTYTVVPGRAEDPPRGITRYTLESSYRQVHCISIRFKHERVLQTWNVCLGSYKIVKQTTNYFGISYLHKYFRYLSLILYDHLIS